MPVSKLDARSWGPAAWSWLHIVAFRYPTRPTDHDRHRAWDVVRSLRDSLPCDKCRVHFAEMIAAETAQGASAGVFASHDAFSRATVRWHNAVNRRLGRPTYAYAMVARWYHPDTASRASSWEVLLLLVVWGVLGWQLARCSSARRHSNGCDGASCDRAG
jgi:hypothetical protein